MFKRILLYGGGALLIREVARRRRLGWPGIILLGLAYAVIEEDLLTQSLFNPGYVGLRLLDYGFISALGIGAYWTVFVLAIHGVWSIAVPISIVEAGSRPESRRTIRSSRCPSSPSSSRTRTRSATHASLAQPPQRRTDFRSARRQSQGKRRQTRP